MTILALLLSPLLALQGVGDTVIAVKNNDPDTWTLEYPRIVQPYVLDYRRCLTGQMRRVTGEANFETQHASDIPACEKEFEQAVADSTRVLSGRERYEDWTPATVRTLFVRMGAIHVARGADLDNQFRLRIQRAARARANYDDEKPRGLVLELHDASVVKARTDATASAAEAAIKDDDAKD
ncbi:hypothetical protein [Erythrobacter sp.]|uniref:hypothetical protein n=1 Tax=Erythrobacter sp. TaxID=1042 RepID=UPI003C70ADDD